MPSWINQSSPKLSLKEIQMTKLELELQDTAAEVKDETTQTIEDQYISPLGRAIAYWQAGSYIPLTLATELMADGYDVGVLEARYLKD